MKRLALVMCVAWGVALCCCSDDNPVLDPESAQQALQDCTQVGIFSMLRMVSAVDDLIEVIEEDFTEDGITVTESQDPTDPDYTWDVQYDLPASGSGTPDTRLAGKLTFSADPTDQDGIQFGDMVTMALTITSLGGPYTGLIDGDVTIVDGNTSLMSGRLVLNDASGGCNLDFTIPTTPGLALSDVGFFGEPQLAANVFGILIEGVVNLLVTTGGHTLDGILTLDDQSQDATVTNATIDEIDIDDFSFQVAPEPETILALNECIYGSLFIFQTVIYAIGPVAEEIASPGTHAFVTITPVSATVFDFEVDTDGGILMGIGGIDGIVEGRVTFGATPALPATVTWSFDPDDPGLTAQSTTPLMVVLPTESTNGSVYGSGSLSIVEGEVSCAGTFAIPAAFPLELEMDPEFNFGDSGRVIFESTVAGNTLRLTIDLSAEEEIIEASLNGIPIPAELILAFL